MLGQSEAFPMRKRSQRLWFIGVAVVLVAGAAALAVPALSDTVAFFATPSQLAEKNLIKEGKSASVGGLVERGSVEHIEGGVLTFRITDGTSVMPVSFDGIPPDLFEEGQGVVAEGKFDANGQLVAKRVLAKHDEQYIPKEIYEDMKARSGEAGATEYAIENGKTPE
jgi:cytochrome c-type biogenesis protein CcmE